MHSGSIRDVLPPPALGAKDPSPSVGAGWSPGPQAAWCVTSTNACVVSQGGRGGPEGAKPVLIMTPSPKYVHYPLAASHIHKYNPIHTTEGRPCAMAPGSDSAEYYDMQTSSVASGITHRVHTL